MAKIPTFEEAFLLLQGARDEQKALTHNPGEILDVAYEEVNEGEDTMAELEAIEAAEAG